MKKTIEEIHQSQMRGAVKNILNGKQYANDIVTIIKFQYRNEFPNLSTKAALVVIEVIAECN